MTSAGYKPYREKAIERYGEKCQACSREKKIEVHHIDADPQNNDISNLIPLCHWCHNEVFRNTKKMRTHILFESIETDNWLVEWLIRQKRWAKFNRKLVEEQDESTCKNPFCDARPIEASKNGEWCYYGCRHKYEEFVERTPELVDYPNMTTKATKEAWC